MAAGKCCSATMEQASCISNRPREFSPRDSYLWTLAHGEWAEPLLAQRSNRCGLLQEGLKAINSGYRADVSLIPALAAFLHVAVDNDAGGEGPRSMEAGQIESWQTLRGVASRALFARLFDSLRLAFAKP